MSRRKRCIWALIALVALSAVGAAGLGFSAERSYPYKAIELVVAFAAGGANDTAGRLTAKYLSAEFRVPVNITNKPGGNQIPAVLSVLSAPADGYTLFNEAPGTSVMQGLLNDLPYKVEDRTFGPMVAESQMCFFVGGKSPWNSLKDVAEAIRKDPGSFTWMWLGGGTITDFTLLQFFDVAGIEVPKTKPVPFVGSNEAMTAVAGGHVMFGSSGVGAVSALRSSGNLKVLAVTGDTRLQSLADVPTTKEAGFPGANVGLWYGISGPKGLPKNVLDRLDAALKKIVQDPAYIKDTERLGNRAKYMPPDQMREMILKQIQQFRAISANLPKAR